MPPKPKNKLTPIISSLPVDLKTEKNIECHMKCITEDKLFDTENNTLKNPFEKCSLTPDQIYDLLNFRKIGQQHFLQRISAVILKNPSVKAPNRKLALKTFSIKKKKQKSFTFGKRQAAHSKCHEKKMTFSKRTHQPILNLEEQLIELPLAICDNEGISIKGQKVIQLSTIKPDMSL